MFYLMTHSTHFILRLYGIRHMVKDHSDSERANLLPPHGLLFMINSKGSFICTIPDRIAHTTAFVTLEREIAQWVHHMKDRSNNPSLHLALPTNDALCVRQYLIFVLQHVARFILALDTRYFSFQPVLHDWCNKGLINSKGSFICTIND